MPSDVSIKCVQGKIEKYVSCKESLYELKQTPLRFINFLKLQGLKQLKTEKCMFKNNNDTLLMYLR